MKGLVLKQMRDMAPIVLFVYNRPDHTKRTVEALAKNKLAQYSNLYIISDGYKDENQKDKVISVREYIHSIESKKMFKKVEVIENVKNKGLATSIISGVSLILNLYDKIIVLEDDLVVSSDFLEYMNRALIFYEKKNNVWSVSGYTPELYCLLKYDKDVYASPRGCSWGWGTWKNRWCKVDWKVRDYELFKRNRKMKKEFLKGGPDMVKMLEDQMNGKIDSWAIRWCYQECKEQMITIYPRVSRVQNIGCDNTGTHCGYSNMYDVHLNNSLEKVIFVDAKVDKNIMKEFRLMYDYGITGSIKRHLYRIVSTFFQHLLFL
mgnify:CR=1 FL=1